ncbi:hypothetical protein AAC387_Pa09g1528 [Persea americana]
MPINRDVEHGGNVEPLIQRKKKKSDGADDDGSHCNNDGSMSMVLLSTFVAVCGSFEFGICVGYSAPTEASIRRDLGLSLSEYSIFGSIVTVGAMIGAVTSGRIADLLGRKGAMRMSSVICIAGWVAIYFSKGAVSLDLGRFCSGYGIGVLSYVVPVFIAEIAPKNLRGGLTTVNQLLICSGLSFAYIVGTFVTWRTLAWIGLVPCIMQVVGLSFIPESPRWLAKVGHGREFEDSLRRLRGKDADISDEALEIQDYIKTLQSLPKARIHDLLQRRYSRSVIVGVGLMVFQQFAGINGIVFYASETFVTSGFSSGKVGTIAVGCIQAPITALGAILMDKTGRRPLLLISVSGMLLGCIVSGMSFYFKSHQMLLDWAPLLVLTGIMVYIGSFSLGMGGVPWVMMSEIFPINIKGIAGSLVTLVNWFGSWVISFAFKFLMSWSSSGTFFLFGGICALAILFITNVVPETKGRTLEEIQASMNS